MTGKRGWVDDRDCYQYFFRLTISSPIKLVMMLESGKNYFVEQYLKLGVFVGGANLRQVDEATGKAEVSNLSMAVKGKCSTEVLAEGVKE